MALLALSPQPFPGSPWVEPGPEFSVQVRLKLTEEAVRGVCSGAAPRPGSSPGQSLTAPRPEGPSELETSWQNQLLCFAGRALPAHGAHGEPRGPRRGPRGHTREQRPGRGLLRGWDSGEDPREPDTGHVPNCRH